MSVTKKATVGLPGSARDTSRIRLREARDRSVCESMMAEEMVRSGATLRGALPIISHIGRALEGGTMPPRMVEWRAETAV